MKRDPERLSRGGYDLLVVGAGIHGAFAAWDATLRGLRVAIIDQGDFGAGASANSLKIIHGGLRYLQQADLRRVLESAREQAIHRRIAPWCVRPLPCLLPAEGSPTRSRAALGLALRIHGAIAARAARDMRGLEPLPPGRIVEQDQIESLAPSLAARGTKRAALWHEALAVDTERLTLAPILAAAERGADAANYLRAERILTDGAAIAGVRARDLVLGGDRQIGARCVLLASGALSRRESAELLGSAPPLIRSAVAMNLIVRPLSDRAAFGLRAARPDARGPLDREGLTLFFVPWRGTTMIGTSYRLRPERPAESEATIEDIRRLIDAANRALGAEKVRMDDVLHFHCGLLPVTGGNDARGSRGDLSEPARGAAIRNADARLRLANRHAIIDCKKTAGIRGLAALVGVKYTTARLAAAEAIDLVCERLGHAGGPCATDTAILPVPPDPEMGESSWPIDSDGASLEGAVRRAIGDEMAVHLSDLVFRRIGLGSAGPPPRAILEKLATLMGDELGWTDAERGGEIDAVLRSYAPLPCAGSTAVRS